MVLLGSCLNGGVGDCGDSGPSSNLPPRTHKAGWRLSRIIKCVLGDNKQEGKGGSILEGRPVPIPEGYMESDGDSKELCVSRK